MCVAVCVWRCMCVAVYVCCCMCGGVCVWRCMCVAVCVAVYVCVYVQPLKWVYQRVKRPMKWGYNNFGVIFHKPIFLHIFHDIQKLENGFRNLGFQNAPKVGFRQFLRLPVIRTKQCKKKVRHLEKTHTIAESGSDPVKLTSTQVTFTFFCKQNGYPSIWLELGEEKPTCYPIQRRFLKYLDSEGMIYKVI